MYYLSRGFVPIALFVMYKRGMFAESFQMKELKYMIRIAVVMHLIDLSGHFMLQFLSMGILDKHIGLNE